MKYVSIKKYDKYQHYKTRNPPWIKLYRCLLHDYEMRSLPIPSRLTYIGLLIVASETDNRIPIDYKYLSERLGFDVTEHILTTLITSGFLLALGAKRMLAHDALCSSLLSSSDLQPASQADAVESSLNPLQSLTLKDNPDLKSKKRAVKTGAAVSVSLTGLTWGSYRTAYIERYNTPPVCNAKVNGQLAQVVKRLGAASAPNVAAFYLQHNEPFYVRSRHSVNFLLRDCEGLHTQMMTGVKATTGEAKNVEFKDNVVEQVKRIEALRKGAQS